jgi:EAL domain-containing protein (putative c-di-GMP-specific phosphodiesterase class I)
MIFWLPNYTNLEGEMIQLNIDDTEHSGLAVKFEMQPILVNPNMSLSGYELLYRGPRPANWPAVDKVLLNYVKRHPGRRPTLFINLSNETILTEDLAAYIPANSRATTYIELTESLDGGHEYHEVAKRVNTFAAQGIRFALDDFGSGLDGLHRHAALNQVSYVKLDRLFLRQAAENPTTRRIVEMLIAEWARSNTLAVAEGIENPHDLAFASKLGVQLVQGFFIDDIHQSEPTQSAHPRLVHSVIAA